MNDKSTQSSTHGAFTLDLQDSGVAVITMDVPGDTLNTLKAEFRDDFKAVMEALKGSSSAKAAVIISGKESSFLAGADIKMLDAATSPEAATEMSRVGQIAFDALEGGHIPVVAAIHGPCLGGGMELALACHGRVISDSPKTILALPEVQLGLLPGAGGTQRLPRLIGIQGALDMMLTGRNIRPAKAKKMGLVDDVVPRTILLKVATELALDLAEGNAPRKKEPPAGEKVQTFALEENSLGRRVLFSQARKQLLAKSHGNYPAAERIIDCVEAGMDHGFTHGLEVEAEAFGQLVMSEVSQQLRSIFFATTALKKDTGVDDPEVKPRDVSRVGVLGAGLMGAGVAFVTATKAKVPVRIKDRDDEGVMRGLATINGLLQKRVKKRALTPQAAKVLSHQVSGTIDYVGIEACDVVIEAVFEDLNLKHSILKEIEALGRDDIIFASNTSSLPITKIAEASAHPETVIGMHYFSPVEKMPLLEIITTEKTADWVTATCVKLGKAQGKTVIVVRDGVGFYTSRILGPYMNEAVRILSEGVPIDRIDKALVEWGFPVGPIVLADEVGLDVGEKVGHIMIEAFGERMSPPEGMEALVADGRKGRKNGRGFYTYGGKNKEVDHSVYELLNIKPFNKMDHEEIALRCALLMVNEAVRCLEEGILRSPRDGDIGAIFGLGFPPFRGGPFRYIDSMGAQWVVDKLKALESEHGLRFAPAQLLLDTAQAGKRFHGD